MNGWLDFHESVFIEFGGGAVTVTSGLYVESRWIGPPRSRKIRHRIVRRL